MADDLHVRLEEANAHFQSRKYDACLQTLASCPQDDPKVAHNTVICQAVKSPQCVKGTVAKLDLPPVQRVKNGKTGALTPMVVLQYSGQETALLNAAFLYLHNGNAYEARTILMALTELATALSPASRARLAVLLHLATRHTKEDVSELTSALLKDVGNLDETPALSSMLSVAFADTSALHSWFAGGAKTIAERALYLNNLGVEAFADGKLAVAGVYFARARKCCQDDTCRFLADSVAYNLALVSLVRGSPDGAVGALLQAKTTMSASPLLWIRLAQALVNQSVATTKTVALAEYEQAIVSQVEALHKGVNPRFPVVPPQVTAVVGDAGSLLTAAATALHNALTLLVERNEKIVDAARRLAASPDTALWLDTVLTTLAYVELTRGNHGVVVTIANEYTVMERDVRNATAPRSQAVMACYHIEALCASGKNSQALRVLQSLNLGLYVSHKAPNAAIEALMINVCVTYIMNAQWTKAIQLSQQLISKLNTPVAQLLLAYLDLAQGNRQAAVDIIEALPQQPIEPR